MHFVERTGRVCIGRQQGVSALLQRLRAAGFKPGVASRGYGRSGEGQARWVDAATPPADGGDEPVLIARHTGTRVRVDRDRVAAAKALVAAGCDVVICDDGLQHYRLRRDIEIEVIDGARRYGNGRLMPAGPLREPAARAAECDFRVVNLPDTEGAAGFDLSSYIFFFSDAYSLNNLSLTLWTTGVCALLLLIVSLPIALYLRFAKGGIASYVQALAILPMFVPSIILAYALIRVLGPNGMVDLLLNFAGLPKLRTPYLTPAGPDIDAFEGELAELTGAPAVAAVADDPANGAAEGGAHPDGEGA